MIIICNQINSKKKTRSVLQGWSGKSWRDLNKMESAGSQCRILNYMLNNNMHIIRAQLNVDIEKFKIKQTELFIYSMST